MKKAEGEKKMIEESTKKKLHFGLTLFNLIKSSWTTIVGAAALAVTTGVVSGGVAVNIARNSDKVVQQELRNQLVQINQTGADNSAELRRLLEEQKLAIIEQGRLAAEALAVTAEQLSGDVRIVATEASTKLTATANSLEGADIVTRNSLTEATNTIRTTIDTVKTTLESADIENKASLLASIDKVAISFNDKINTLEATTTALDTKINSSAVVLDSKIDVSNADRTRDINSVNQALTSDIAVTNATLVNAINVINNKTATLDAQILELQQALPTVGSISYVATDQYVNSDYYAYCDGGTYNGVTVPDINGQELFVRGGTTGLGLIYQDTTAVNGLSTLVSGLHTHSLAYNLAIGTRGVDSGSSYRVYSNTVNDAYSNQNIALSVTAQDSGLHVHQLTGDSETSPISTKLKCVVRIK
jgi:hypothetical protein